VCSDFKRLLGYWGTGVRKWKIGKWEIGKYENGNLGYGVIGLPGIFK
jgi:hypothetical protein